MNKTNIVLIGFAGAGKTTIGNKLAKKLNYNFIDLDRYFEKKYRFSIFHFFDLIGEELFRKLEHETLLEVIAEDCCVIATGGGTPCFHNNIELINRHAISIYIELAPASLHHRLLHSKKRRPLTQKLNPEELLHYIETTLSQRETYYKQATITVKGENFEIDELVKKILNS